MKLPFSKDKKKLSKLILLNLSLKAKLIIGAVTILVIGLLSVLFFTISMETLDKIDKEIPEATENTSRPIYDGNQPKVEIVNDDTKKMQFEDAMIQGGFDVTTQQVLMALQQLNIQLTDEYVKGGSKMPANVTKFIKENLPCFIAIYVKRGLLPGTAIMQGGLESGWGGHPVPGSNNYFGIKAAGPHTDYWKGDFVNYSSAEGEGSGRHYEVSKFRKYKNMDESKLDWGEFLYTNKRYKPAFSKTTSLEQVKAIQYAGYSNSPSTYINFANSTFNRYKLQRFDDLAVLVKQQIARNGGQYLTPNGNQVPNTEWKPGSTGGNIDAKWGYICDPKKGHISSYFGARTNPVTGKHESAHGALDYAVPSGTTVYAARGGVVVDARLSSSYGNVIAIDHGDGYYTRYAHNSRLLVNKGDKVVRGQEIAKAGSTGRSTGPHIHFEILKGWSVNAKNGIDPLKTFYEEKRVNDKMILQPRGAKPFSAETIKEDPGTVAGNDASVNAGFDNGKPTPAGNSLIQACSFMQEQGINPSSLSKERLAVFYEGRKWFGSWYAWGGKTPPKKNSDGSWQTPHRTGGVVGGYALAGPGFDCSGYVGYIFKQVFKVNMGSGSYEQGHSKYAKLIDVNQAKPGDIYWHSGHIAIFVKHDAKYIYVMQSPQTGEKIGWGKFSKRTPYRITRPTFYKD